MFSIQELRIALVGTSLPLLTVGLMAARRDLTLIGICPNVKGLNKQESTSEAHDKQESALEEPVNQESTLEAHGKQESCPATYGETIFIPESETIAQLSTLLLGCPVYKDCQELIKGADLVIYDSDFCDNRPDSANPHVNAQHWQSLWGYLNQPITSQSDGGILDWEQAESLVTPLFHVKHSINS